MFRVPSSSRGSVIGISVRIEGFQDWKSENFARVTLVDGREVNIVKNIKLGYSTDDFFLFPLDTLEIIIESIEVLVVADPV
jgi:hypothetical protein